VRMQRQGVQGMQGVQGVQGAQGADGAMVGGSMAKGDAEAEAEAELDALAYAYEEEEVEDPLLQRKLRYVALRIHRLGLKVGVCIAPGTSDNVLYDLLRLRVSGMSVSGKSGMSGKSVSGITGKSGISGMSGINVSGRSVQLVDYVDVLAVNPGFGGQPFDHSVLRKVEALRRAHPHLDIAVDGGVGVKTAVLAASLGANVLIAGSSIFGRDRQIIQGVGPIKANYDSLLSILMRFGA
jgi:pentose-5-phosphate-3-epimerase